MPATSIQAQTGTPGVPSNSNERSVGYDTTNGILVVRDSSGNTETIPADSGRYADRVVRVAVLDLDGDTIAAASGFAAWQNPESSTILILDCVLAANVVSTGACTLDVGTTATSATTTSDNIFDGIDAAAATPPLYYVMRNDALDTAANVNVKELAAGKWVTVDEKTGDAEGFEGKLYITYIVL